MRFTAEVLQNAKMCFPCSVRSTFFFASHAAWEAHFWNRFDPYGKNDIFQRWLKVAVAAVRRTFLSTMCVSTLLQQKGRSGCGEKQLCVSDPFRSCLEKAQILQTHEKKTSHALRGPSPSSWSLPSRSWRSNLGPVCCLEPALRISNSWRQQSTHTHTHTRRHCNIWFGRAGGNGRASPSLFADEGFILTPH